MNSLSFYIHPWVLEKLGPKNYDIKSFISKNNEAATFWKGGGKKTFWKLSAMILSRIKWSCEPWGPLCFFTLANFVLLKICKATVKHCFKMLMFSSSLCLLKFCFVIFTGQKTGLTLSCCWHIPENAPFRSAVLDDVMSQSELTTHTHTKKNLTFFRQWTAL